MLACILWTLSGSSANKSLACLWSFLCCCPWHIPCYHSYQCFSLQASAMFCLEHPLAGWPSCDENWRYLEVPDRWKLVNTPLNSDLSLGLSVEFAFCHLWEVQYRLESSWPYCSWRSLSCPPPCPHSLSILNYLKVFFFTFSYPFWGI